MVGAGYSMPMKTKGEIPKPTRNEICMLNSKEWCENKFHEVILQSLKQTYQFCDKRSNNHNFPQRETHVMMNYEIDNRIHKTDILITSTEKSLQEDDLVIMFKRSKRLKHKRLF